MADVKITALAALVSASADDILGIIDDPGGSPVSKKITVANLIRNCAIVATTQVISSLSVDIVNTTLSVSAGVLYRIDAQVMFNRATTSTQSRWGLKFPHVKATRGRIFVAMSVVQGVGTVSSIGAFGVWNGDSASGSAIVAVPGAGSSITRLSTLAIYDGVLYASAGGAIVLQGGATSASSGSISILPGSYLRLVRIN